MRARIVGEIKRQTYLDLKVCEDVADIVLALPEFAAFAPPAPPAGVLDTKTLVERVKAHRTLHGSNLKVAHEAVQNGWTPPPVEQGVESRESAIIRGALERLTKWLDGKSPYLGNFCLEDDVRRLLSAVPIQGGE